MSAPLDVEGLAKALHEATREIVHEVDEPHRASRGLAPQSYPSWEGTSEAVRERRRDVARKVLKRYVVTPAPTLAEAAR